MLALSSRLLVANMRNLFLTSNGRTHSRIEETGAREPPEPRTTATALIIKTGVKSCSSR